MSENGAVLETRYYTSSRFWFNQIRLSPMNCKFVYIKLDKELKDHFRLPSEAICYEVYWNEDKIPWVKTSKDGMIRLTGCFISSFGVWE